MKTLRYALSGAVAGSMLAASATAAGIDMSAVAQAAARPLGPGVAGNTYEVSSGQNGATVLTVTLPSGFKYLIVNDQCVIAGSPPTGCERLGFLVIFGQTAGDFSYETLNTWNATRPPQVFKTPDGRTMMIHYMLARDGVSAGNLAQNFEFWNDSVIAINNYLSAAPKSVAVNASGVDRSLDAVLRSWFEHGLIGDDDGNERLSRPD